MKPFPRKTLVSRIPKSFSTRWMSTRVRWLLAAIISFAPLSGIRGDGPNDARTRDAIRAIKELGGRANWQRGGWEIGFHLRGRQLTDSDLKVLHQLNPIYSLNLRDTQVSDAGMEQLGQIKSLRRLHLERTKVGDAGIKRLTSLSHLSYLNLYGTRVTDEGLDDLARLKALRSLYLWKTGVTLKGRERLATALPQTRIVGGVDLSKLVDTFPAQAETPKPKLTLTWMPAASREEAPQRSLNGINVQVFFANKSSQSVKLYWITYGGELKLYGVIRPNATRQQNTYENNAWLVTDLEDRPQGWFIALQDDAMAVIP